MRDFREQNYYELLDLAPQASQQELEVAYQRARRIFSKDSVVTYTLFQPEELALLSRRIEEAYRTLTNLERRKRYDEELSKLEGGHWDEGAEAAGAGAAGEGCEAAGETFGQEAPAAPTAPECPAPPCAAEPPAAAGASPVAVAASSAAVEDLPLFQRPPSKPPAEASTLAEAPAGPAAPPPARAEPPASPEPAPAPAPGGCPPGEPAIVSPAPAAVPAPAVGPLAPAEAGVAGTAPAPAAQPSAAPTHTSAAPQTSPPPLAGACPPAMPALDESTVYDGHLLRLAREARGWDIEKLAQLTKINIFYLRRMEENDLGQLPAPAYVRGYLRLLARMLKLDGDKLIAGFEALGVEQR
jgi:hypothetical protein